MKQTITPALLLLALQACAVDAHDSRTIELVDGDVHRFDRGDAIDDVLLVSGDLEIHASQLVDRSELDQLEYVDIAITSTPAHRWELEVKPGPATGRTPWQAKCRRWGTIIVDHDWSGGSFPATILVCTDWSV